MKKFGVSERFACRVLGQHRSTQRKIAKTPDDEAALTYPYAVGRLVFRE